MSKICEKQDIFNEKYPNHYLNWSNIEKEKYFIHYATVPCYYLAKIKAKTMMPGVNSCLESKVYIFQTFKEIEDFFKKLTGE